MTSPREQWQGARAMLLAVLPQPEALTHLVLDFVQHWTFGEVDKERWVEDGTSFKRFQTGNLGLIQTRTSVVVCLSMMEVVLEYAGGAELVAVAKFRDDLGFAVTDTGAILQFAIATATSPTSAPVQVLSPNSLTRGGCHFVLLTADAQHLILLSTAGGVLVANLHFDLVWHLGLPQGALLRRLHQFGDTNFLWAVTWPALNSEVLAFDASKLVAAGSPQAVKPSIKPTASWRDRTGHDGLVVELLTQAHGPRLAATHGLTQVCMLRLTGSQWEVEAMLETATFGIQNILRMGTHTAGILWVATGYHLVMWDVSKPVATAEGRRLTEGAYGPPLAVLPGLQTITCQDKETLQLADSPQGPPLLSWRLPGTLMDKIMSHRQLITVVHQQNLHRGRIGLVRWQ